MAVGYGSFIAGGSDSYCYLSQARLWAHGWPIVDEPLIGQTGGVLGRWTFIPLGYRPGVLTGTFVPICSAGYPLTMAAALRLFGAGAEMYVVPLAAAGLVFVTGWIGYRAGGTLAGVLSALLMATSPIFVFQAVQPMTDVPAAFLWLVSAALVTTGRAWSGPIIVPAVALAILTRPNLTPLALPLLALGVMPHARENRRTGWKTTAAVAAGLTLGVAAVACTNSVLFGAPDSTGYGAPAALYRLAFLSTNVENYGRWLFEAETYLIVLAAAGIVRLALGDAGQRAWGWYAASTVALVCLSYAFYTPFGDWTYLRFLLPALPLAFVGYTCAVKHRWLAIALSLPIFAMHVHFIGTHAVLATQAGERRYLDVSNYVKGTLPQNALLISAQHSGSIRYYTDRKTVRFDWLPPRELDNAIAQLTGLGYKPYIVLDDWEEPSFKSRFRRRSALAALDWRPLMEFTTSPRVRIYDPATRANGVRLTAP